MKLNSLYSLKYDMVLLGKNLYNIGYFASNEGNLSARLSVNKFLITPVEICKGHLRVDDIKIVGSKSTFPNFNEKLSFNVKLNSNIYKSRSDINIICQVYPKFLMGNIILNNNDKLFQFLEDVYRVAKLTLKKNDFKKEEEYLDQISLLLRNHDIFISINFGVVIIANNICDVYNKLRSLEHFAKIAFMTKLINKKTSQIIIDQVIQLKMENRTFLSE